MANANPNQTPQQRVEELEAQLAIATSATAAAVEAAIAGARQELGLVRKELGEAVAAQHRSEAELGRLQEQYTRLKASHERKREGLASAVQIVATQLKTLQHALGEDV